VRFSCAASDSALGQGEILMESGFDFEEIRKLMNKGHKVGFEATMEDIKL
jgi:gamma-glutamyltranspeptidase/glutathione hydrolase